MSVYEKLAAVQRELKAPKGQFNSFGKYKYRSCEDILEALKPVLSKNGCAVVLSDSVEQVALDAAKKHCCYCDYWGGTKREPVCDPCFADRLHALGVEVSQLPINDVAPASIGRALISTADKADNRICKGVMRNERNNQRAVRRPAPEPRIRRLHGMPDMRR